MARSLEETNRKLTAARLGESMERGQQAERLQVIEQPSLPQKPVKPKRSKWFAVAVALAALAGTGCVSAAEMLDRRIRGSRELIKIVDRDLIVTLPYLSTPGEAASQAAQSDRGMFSFGRGFCRRDRCRHHLRNIGKFILV